MGLAIGAKAETDLYLPGFLRNYIDGIGAGMHVILSRVLTRVKAPWPPMLWPVMLTLLESSWSNAEKRASGSSFVMYVYMLYPFVQGSLVAST